MIHDCESPTGSLFCFPVYFQAWAKAWANYRKNQDLLAFFLRFSIHEPGTRYAFIGDSPALF